MSKEPSKATKDKRVAFEVPPEIEKEYEAIAKQIGTNRAGLAALAAKFAVVNLKAGRLVRLNNDLVERPLAAA